MSKYILDLLIAEVHISRDFIIRHCCTKMNNDPPDRFRDDLAWGMVAVVCSKDCKLVSKFSLPTYGSWVLFLPMNQPHLCRLSILALIGLYRYILSIYSWIFLLHGHMWCYHDLQLSKYDIESAESPFCSTKLHIDIQLPPWLPWKYSCTYVTYYSILAPLFTPPSLFTLIGKVFQFSLNLYKNYFVTWYILVQHMTKIWSCYNYLMKQEIFGNGVKSADLSGATFAWNLLHSRSKKSTKFCHHHICEWIWDISLPFWKRIGPKLSDPDHLQLWGHKNGHSMVHSHTCTT